MESAERLTLRLSEHYFSLALTRLALMTLTAQTTPVPNWQGEVHRDEIAKIRQHPQPGLRGDAAVQRELVRLDPVHRIDDERREEGVAGGLNVMLRGAKRLLSGANVRIAVGRHGAQVGEWWKRERRVQVVDHGEVLIERRRHQHG